MNTQAVLILAVAIAISWLILSKHKVKKSVTTKFGPEWQFLYSKGMPASPTMTATGWRFDFPTNPGNNVNRVSWSKPPSLFGKREVRMRFAVTGGGFTPWEAPGSQANVSLMIQRKGDDMSAAGAYEAYRQFSSEAIPLAAGIFELVVPLDADHWGGVMGSHDGLQAALEHMESLSVIFGYDGGRAHGVFALQPSTFELLEINVS